MRCVILSSRGAIHEEFITPGRQGRRPSANSSSPRSGERDGTVQDHRKSPFSRIDVRLIGRLSHLAAELGPRARRSGGDCTNPNVWKHDALRRLAAPHYLYAILLDIFGYNFLLIGSYMEICSGYCYEAECWKLDRVRCIAVRSIPLDLIFIFVGPKTLWDSSAVTALTGVARFGPA